MILSSVTNLETVPHFIQESGNTTPEAQKLWKAAKSLEMTFSKYLLTEMGKSLPGTTQVSSGSEIYGDIMKEAVSAKIADSNSLGLAKQLYMSMNKMAEQQAKTSTTKVE